MEPLESSDSDERIDDEEEDVELTDDDDERFDEEEDLTNEAKTFEDEELAIEG